jgi:hypothetical protein
MLSNDSFDQPLWQTFVSTTLGVEGRFPCFPLSPATATKTTRLQLMRLQRTRNGLSRRPHTHVQEQDWMVSALGPLFQTTLVALRCNQGVQHDWFVGVLGPLFRSAGHKVSTQHGVTARAG